MWKISFGWGGTKPDGGGRLGLVVQTAGLSIVEVVSGCL